MGWFEAIRDGIYCALCAAFGYDPDSQDALDKFVPAYEENTMTPQAPRNVDVCYYAVSPFQGDSGFNYIMLNQKSRDGQVKTEIEKTVPANVLVTFYGPKADDEAEAFWSLFQWDNGVNSPRAILRKKHIVPIGMPARPISLYEIEGTMKRRRSDVQVDLAYYEVAEKQSSYITEVPEVSLEQQL